jgi:hypothetical protein
MPVLSFVADSSRCATTLCTCIDSAALPRMNYTTASNTQSGLANRRKALGSRTPAVKSNVPNVRTGMYRTQYRRSGDVRYQFPLRQGLRCQESLKAVTPAFTARIRFLLPMAVYTVFTPFLKKGKLVASDCLYTPETFAHTSAQTVT